jgi:hypothetical protein
MMCATCIMNKIVYNELFLINQNGKVVSCGHHEGTYGSRLIHLLTLTVDTRHQVSGQLRIPAEGSSVTME